MSISTIFDFANSADYTFDPTKIEFVDGKAQLKLIPFSGDFAQDFASSSGFIFDPLKTEFVGGTMRQKDQRPSGATFGATYTSDINGNWGNGILTGTAFGGASITLGKLDLRGGTQKYVTYASVGNAPNTQVGCIRMRYKPNYSGSPSGNRYLFDWYTNPANDTNSLQIYHASNGNMQARLCDSTGNYIFSSFLAAWVPVVGTEYEIEFDFDFTTGATRLFIDGMQIGATITNMGTRTAPAYLRIGAAHNSSNSDGEFDDVVVFPVTQHDSNYTPSYILSDTIYVADIITLPELEYTGPGSLQQVSGIVTIEGNTPRYTLQVNRSGDWLYWDGSVYAISNDTYAQTDTKTIANAHLPELVMAGSLYGQIRVHFTDSGAQQSIDIITTTMIGQRYNTSAIIDTYTPIRNDGIDGMSAMVSGTGSIKYILKKTGIFYYHNGTSWIVSNGTFAQANTIIEILTNKATFTTTTNDLLIRIVIDSNSEQDATIDNMQIDTNFSPSIPSVNTVIVWLYLDDIVGSDVNTPVLVKLNKTAIKYGQGVVLDGTQKTITPVSGYVELTLPDTSTMEVGSYYTIQINSIKYRKIVPIGLTSSALFALPDYVEAT